MSLLSFKYVRRKSVWKSIVILCVVVWFSILDYPILKKQQICRYGNNALCQCFFHQVHLIWTFIILLNFNNENKNWKSRAHRFCFWLVYLNFQILFQLSKTNSEPIGSEPIFNPVWWICITVSLFNRFEITSEKKRLKVTFFFRHGCCHNWFFILFLIMLP